MKRTSFFIVWLVLTTNIWGALHVGDQAPNLIGRTLDNAIYRLSADTQKPKVINFFWIGCQPCRKEIPELAKMEQKYSKIKFISVHAKDDGQKEVKAFIASLEGSPSTIILAGSLVCDRFLFTGLPYTLVLDQNNSVVASFSGYTSENMKQLDEVLHHLNN
jgi:thiol-disulfide isomerase/thioredoxin